MENRFIELKNIPTALSNYIESAEALAILFEIRNNLSFKNDNQIRDYIKELIERETNLYNTRKHAVYERYELVNTIDDVEFEN